MELAALVMLALKMGIASSVSVMFGWQPMPDANSGEDGAKIEYIVQIEPELAATLQEGQSIPITSDIPDDIGPIGRIRIVVGRGELPRQKLVTNFKPWPTKQSRAGLVETQHTVPPVQPSGSGRYDNLAAAANSILPPSDKGAATSNPFGRALQQGAQQAKNLAAGVKQQILPPADQLFGQGGVSGQGVQNAIDNTTNQLRQGLQRGVQQGVQQVADRTGQQLRQAVDNAGQGARNAVDKFGRSLSSERSILNTGHDHAGHDHAAHGQTPSTDTILPPSSGLAGKGQRIDQPIRQQRQQPQRQQPQRSVPPSSFATTTPPRLGTNPSSQPGVFNAPWPSTTNIPPVQTRVNNPPPNRYGNQASQPPAQTSQWPREPSGRDTFDLANREPEGPNFPSSGNQPTSQQSTSQQYGDIQRPYQPPAQTAKPEIRRNMLDQPVLGDVQTASNSQGFQQQTVSRQPFAQQPFNAPPQDTQARGFSWNQYNSDSSNNESGTNNNKNVFPLLLSWVLLTGSGGVNAYLLWSYLDVRNKYHGMVHSSPGRRGRYDD